MEQIEKLQSEALTKIADCQNNQDLNAVRVEYLGKKGPIQNLMKGMKDLTPDQRPAFGQKSIS